MDWYAHHPDHYQGDASVALRELSVQALVETIKAVKVDTMVRLLLQAEFLCAKEE